jgi:hypothetical protein
MQICREPTIKESSDGEQLAARAAERGQLLIECVAKHAQLVKCVQDHNKKAKGK